jgi:hypothetical protein
MVTTQVAAGLAPYLADLLVLTPVYTWDLVDPLRRQEFLLKTTAALAIDTDLLKITKCGPPSAELIELRDPLMPALRVAELQADAMVIYDSTNGKLYRKLLLRLDFSKRDTLAYIIHERFGRTLDGYGLWQYILKQMDFSTGEKQEEIRITFDNYRLLDPIPTPEILHDALYELNSYWVLIAGNSPSNPSSCIRKAISILPDVYGFAYFASTIRAFAAFQPDHFDTYKSFVDMVVEQYRSVLAEKNASQVLAAHIAAPPKPPKPIKFNPYRDAPNNCNICNSVWCTNEEGNEEHCLSFNFELKKPVNISVKELNFLESGRLHIFLNGATTLKDVHFKIVDFEVARFNYHQEQAVATVVSNVAACFYASFDGHVSSGLH